MSQMTQAADEASFETTVIKLLRQITQQLDGPEHIDPPAPAKRMEGEIAAEAEIVPSVQDTCTVCVLTRALECRNRALRDDAVSAMRLRLKDVIDAARKAERERCARMIDNNFILLPIGSTRGMFSATIRSLCD